MTWNSWEVFDPRDGQTKHFTDCERPAEQIAIEEGLRTGEPRDYGRTGMEPDGRGGWRPWRPAFESPARLLHAPRCRAHRERVVRPRRSRARARRGHEPRGCKRGAARQSGTSAGAGRSLPRRLAAVYTALSCLLWLAGELAGCLWTRRWPPAGGADALAVLGRVLRDPAHPSLAWPVAAQHDLAPAPLFYAVVVVLVTGLTVPAARLVMAYLARRRRGADPNPRRAGFATSTGLTTLRTPSVVSARLTPSYDLWLGLERGPMGGLRPLRGRGDRQTAGVVGPPGSGKTLGLILPGLLCWAGSSVPISG